MAKKSSWALFEWATRIFIGWLLSGFILTIADYSAVSSVKKSLFFFTCGGYALILVLLLIEGVLIGSFSIRTFWEKIRPKSWAQRCLLGYLFITFLSALFSKAPAVAWLGGSRGESAITIALYIICFYGVSKFARPGRWMMYLFGGVLTAFSLLCILQLSGLNPFGLYPQGGYHDGGTSYIGEHLGTIGNVGLVASYFCIAIPIHWIYILRSKDRWRWILLVPLILTLFVLLRMWVLAGLVGVFGGAVLSLPWILPMGKKAKILYWSSCGIAAFAAILVLYFVDFGSGMLHELHWILHGNFDGDFATGRFRIWSAVLKMVPQNFFFGAGPDTLSLAGIEFSHWVDEVNKLEVKTIVDAAHNEYLNILYHQGIFALLAYLGGLGDLLFRWIRTGGKNPGAALFGGAVVCYCVQAFFGISQFITTPLFWACLGLLEYFCTNDEKQGGRK